MMKDFRRFLSQFSTDFPEISHTLFAIHVIDYPESFDKYIRYIFFKS